MRDGAVTAEKALGGRCWWNGEQVTIAMSKPNDSMNGQLVAERQSSDHRDLAIERSPSEPLSSSDVAALRRILDSLSGAGVSPNGNRIVIKAGRRLVFLDTVEIDWIEAYGNYVKFHVGRESHIVRSGIGQIAEKLNPIEFVRIHRSTIVNIKKVKELEPCDNGEYIVALKDGKQLSCSRGYGARLQQVVKRGYSI
jgi:DNA-binding LytR/AlgR family response regulator